MTLDEWLDACPDPQAAVIVTTPEAVRLQVPKMMVGDIVPGHVYVAGVATMLINGEHEGLLRDVARRLGLEDQFVTPTTH